MERLRGRTREARLLRAGAGDADNAAATTLATRTARGIVTVANAPLYDSGSLNAINSAARFGGALIASTMYCWPLCR